MAVGIAFEDGIKAADVRASCARKRLARADGYDGQFRYIAAASLILRPETDVDTLLDTPAYCSGEVLMKHLLKLSALTPKRSCTFWM